MVTPTIIRRPWSQKAADAASRKRCDERTSEDRLAFRLEHAKGCRHDVHVGADDPPDHHPAQVLACILSVFLRVDRVIQLGSRSALHTHQAQQLSQTPARARHA